MMKSLIGTKVGMSQMFSQDGTLIAVTAIHVEPNVVVGVKTQSTHGYDAVLVGYGDIREKLVSRPVKGQFKKANQPLKRHLIELRGVTGYNVGDLLKLEDSFQIGDFVDIQGTSRGHGFTGAIKLWNFSMGARSHGAGWPHRYQGSLTAGRGGASAQRVWKGKKMAGRYGNETVSVIHSEIVGLEPEQNLLLVRGSVPGRNKGVLRIKTTTRSKKATKTPFQMFVRDSGATK
ncbi:large subunit ribosomal protein L3 [Mycoplasmoides fastidiosum]|uniref:Large ribosomal subunit protein uL3 n=1 Tax=Mycoplasmoides fastidiosum TaxID=92758 RepID=A0ABU0LY51_9BACT|nr:50S ribosomal protein L3 [Mycoplasmoides fastidiosum]MDQ0513634.1 large subunit ribosomal protein L3 [Mycoplasmoides fastidiosum]UUD37946.1 50S ribosomal protein L3 [Mycoplasmoides fastidiosum]